MKNYYQILEVDRNASSEVIEKAYKTLVKKYHPDLQPNEKKRESENKIKLINEAYDILSNKEKKFKYDNDLKKIEFQNEQLKQEELKRKYQNTNMQNTRTNLNNNLKTTIKKPKVNTYYQNNETNNNNLYNQEINRAYNKAYHDAYIKALNNMGYRIRYKKTFKEQVRYVFSMFLFLLILIFICFVLWHIPFIKGYLIDLYNSSDVIKLFVDFFISIFSNLVDMFK